MLLEGRAITLSIVSKGGWDDAEEDGRYSEIR
jgi:hypothetical protein